jgi:tape measure domain-containing protein
MAQKSVSVRLVAEGGRQVRAEFQGIGDAGERNFQRIERQADITGAVVRRVMGILGAAISTRQLVAYADQWTDLSSRVDLATGSQQAGAAVMDRLAAMARRTYSSLGQTTESWLANATALRELGLSTAESLDFTEALNNAMVVSGARAERAASVQNALSKAMALGTLSGDNLNTVIQSGGRLAELLAAELGTTVSGLRGLGQRGEITGDVIRTVLVGNLERLREEADSMPATIGDAFTLIGNATLQLVGTWDQMAGTSATVAGALIGLADNLERLAAIGIAVAGVMAGRWVAAFVAARVATLTLSGALTLLRGALIRTGIGALIVGAGELIYWFGQLARGAGGFGAAMGLLRDVAVEVWDRIRMGASSAGARATAMFLDIKADAAGAMASAISSVVDFGNSAVNTFQGTFHAVQAVWNALPDVFARIGALAMNTLIEAMQSGLAGVTEAINTLLTLGGRRPEWAIAAPDLGNWMAVVPEAVDIGGRAAEGFARGFETNLLAVPDLGLEAIASEALSSANTYRQAAEDLARGATAPLASWQALTDAVTSAGNDGADALTDAEGSARRLTEALEDTEEQATRAGGAARQAGADAATGANEAATGWRAVSAALADYARDAMDWGKGLGQTLVGAFRAAETAFREFVKTGKLDFKGLVASILQDLAVLQFRNAVLGPIANALTSAFGGWGGGNITAAVSHAGGMVGISGYTRQAPALAFAGAPRLHSGGTVAPVGPRKPGGRGWAGLRPDEVPTILQRGERVLNRREAAQYGGDSGTTSRVRIELGEGLVGHILEQAGSQSVEIAQSSLRDYDRLVAPRTLARVSQDPRRRG